MEFIKLNSWKLFCIFCLCMTIFSGFAFFVYLSIRTDITFSESIRSILELMYGFAVVYFLVYFFGGMYHFYRARRLLSYVLSLNIFDNNDHSKGYIYQKSSIFYTQECYYGTVNGYPTVASISQRISKYSRTTIDFHIAITKFNRTISEPIRFQLNWKGEPEGNIKQGVTNLISAFKEKGYEKGDVLTVIENNLTNYRF